MRINLEKNFSGIESVDNANTQDLPTLESLLSQLSTKLGGQEDIAVAFDRSIKVIN